MRFEEIILNEERNVKLSAWIEDVEGEYGSLTKRPAIIIMPGGAYLNCSQREAEIVGFSYAKAGYQVFVLRYSVAEHRAWPNPILDYEQTMELLFEKSEEWHIQTDKIAVVGFSAGGHLAATAATTSKYRPNAALIGYGCLDRETSDLCQPGMPSPVEVVDDLTCPCFLFAARDDSLVDISNTLDFQKALWEKGISFESHIYAFGEHGFSIGTRNAYDGKICSRAANWVEDSISWLSDVFGVLTCQGFEEPVCDKKVNDNREEFLSIRCTIGHLRGQKGSAEAIVDEIYTKIEAGVKQVYGPIAEPVLAFMQKFKLGDLMKMFGCKEEEIVALNTILKTIPNQIGA